MALRTKESLQKMLQSSKERQQKKRQQAEIKKLKIKEEKYQQNLINQKLDRAKEKLRLQREKEKKMEELQALIKKTPQKPLNEATEPSNTFNTYHNKYVERNAAEEDLYTLEELKNIETLYPNETGRINWVKWRELIAKNREAYE